jgi:hypothetical protein
MERNSPLTSQAIEAVSDLFDANGEREFNNRIRPEFEQKEEDDDTPDARQLNLFQDEAHLTEETKSRYPHLEATTVDPKFLADDAYRDVLKGNIMFRARCASRLSREQALHLTQIEKASAFHTTRVESKR